MKNNCWIFAITVFMVVFSACTKKNESCNSACSIKIGDYKIHLLSEGQGEGNSGILIGATSDILQECAPELTFPMATNVFLIQTPNNNILVDAGYGRLLFDHLDSLGLNVEQIDAILLTHMHGDHIGGLLKEGQVAFPNAKLYIPQPEYDFWAVSDNAGALQVLTEYASQIQLFEPNSLENPEQELISGIVPIAAYGHTPGHTAFWVKSKGKELLIWGDLTHAMAIQMPYPQVAVTYDVDPETAVQSREKILKFVSEKAIPIAGMHIPFPSVGNIQSLPNGGYEFIAANKD